MDFPYWTLLLPLPWVAIGVGAVVVLLYRHGHRDRSWLLIGAVLGPLIVPIAVERAKERSRRLEGPAAPASTERTADRGPCVLIGVDGSPESEEAVWAAIRLAAPTAGRFLLASVVSSEAADGGHDDECARAEDLLSRHRRSLPEGPVVQTQVVAGQPAAALLELAEAEDVDLIVVGRRGRGLSRAVLGSAATALSTRSRCPVLLAAPPAART